MKKRFTVYCEKGKIIYIDDKFLQYFQLSVLEVLGKSFQEAFKKCIFEYKETHAFLIKEGKAAWITIKKKAH